MKEYEERPEEQERQRDYLKDSISLYISQVTVHQLLSHEEEIELSKKIESARGEIIRALLKTSQFRSEVERFACDTALALQTINNLFMLSRGRQRQSRTPQDESKRFRRGVRSLLRNYAVFEVAARDVHDTRSRYRLKRLTETSNRLLRQKAPFREEFIRNHLNYLFEIERFCLSETALLLEAGSDEPAAHQTTKERIEAKLRTVWYFLLSDYLKLMDCLRDNFNKWLEARSQLVQSNTRLVISVAKSYLTPRVDFLDLIQAGNQGVIIAAERFDWRRGTRFSTFATKWIQHGIRREISQNSRTIRIPDNIINRLAHLRKVVKKFDEVHGRKPTAEELSTIMGFSIPVIKDLLKHSLHTVSLDQRVRFDDDATIGDFVPDQRAISPLEATDWVVQREMFENALRHSTLTQKEEQVIRLHFGIWDNEPMTLEEVGNIFGVTRERIRQIKEKGLKKLRKFLKSDSIAGR